MIKQQNLKPILDTTLKPLQNDPIPEQSKVQGKEKICDDKKDRNESAMAQEELLYIENTGLGCTKIGLKCCNNIIIDLTNVSYEYSYFYY